MRLYLAQRISAMVMVPLVIGHLGLIVYAVNGGLDAAEILSRTRGSVGWGVYYGVFVVAASVHAATGLRIVVSEWLRLKGLVLDALAAGAGLGLLILGGRAVIAVIFA